MNNRERLLEVRRFFERFTDENNPKTLEEIAAHLAKVGDVGKLTKKSLKEDIRALNGSRFEVLDELEKNGLAKKYWHSSRMFETHELRMMIDAIVAAKFITGDDTGKIVGKIKQLTSEPEAETLRAVIKIPKNQQSQVAYHVDRIQRAISEQKAVSFQYLDVRGFDVEKRRFPLRKNGRRYRVNPIDLHWNHEQYYLIGVDESIGELRNYRVDRMVNSQIIEDGTPREREELPEDYYQKSFNMYNGADEEVVLRVEETVLPVIFDKLGEDVAIRRQGESLLVTFEAAISEGFIYWLLSLGDQVEVLEPLAFRETFGERVRNMAGLYA